MPIVPKRTMPRWYDIKEPVGLPFRRKGSK